MTLVFRQGDRVSYYKHSSLTEADASGGGEKRGSAIVISSSVRNSTLRDSVTLCPFFMHDEPEARQGYSLPFQDGFVRPDLIQSTAISYWDVQKNARLAPASQGEISQIGSMFLDVVVPTSQKLRVKANQAGVNYGQAWWFERVSGIDRVSPINRKSLCISSPSPEGYVMTLRVLQPHGPKAFSPLYFQKLHVDRRDQWVGCTTIELTHISSSRRCVALADVADLSLVLTKVLATMDSQTHKELTTRYGFPERPGEMRASQINSTKLG